MASSSTPVNTNDSTLLLTGIPADQNTAINLCNHFCKFGKILWIESPFNGTPSAATVKFDTQVEASAAFNSKEALLNNRFIKMSWICSPNPGTSSAATSAATPSGQNDDKKCKLCDREFASSWHRDNHIKRIHSGSGIKCNECDATFTSANLYKKHCSVLHSDTMKKPFVGPNASPTSVKPEAAPSKFDYSLAEKVVLLRLRVKSMKKIMKKSTKANSKALKLMEKKKQLVEDQLEGKDDLIQNIIKEKDDVLKSKESALTSLQQGNAGLQEQNFRLKQTLQNERQKVEMLRETLSVLVNLNNSCSHFFQPNEH